MRKDPFNLGFKIGFNSQIKFHLVSKTLWLFLIFDFLPDLLPNILATRSPSDSQPSHFYHHLYCYALQQQINAALAGNSDHKPPTEPSTSFDQPETKTIAKQSEKVKKTKKKLSKLKREKSLGAEKQATAELFEPTVDSTNWSECECEQSECTSHCRKLRRNRTVFTELQLMGLERRFDSQKYLSTPDR